ncbi:hypothetical protein EVAR_97670_1 [Eumeta japonica]|uniref:Uncharacterized protein n=1 Tax=Eumeta variegata TaxID=151549 RepID=A0A4C1X0V7_EUMVA|nr:hypothetical protein EVAR_97670_1 [Eumeta japonica]
MSGAADDTFWRHPALSTPHTLIGANFSPWRQLRHVFRQNKTCGTIFLHPWFVVTTTTIPAPVHPNQICAENAVRWRGVLRPGCGLPEWRDFPELSQTTATF